MADQPLAFVAGGSALQATSIQIAAGVVTIGTNNAGTLTGEWVTGCHGAEIQAVALAYDEDVGGASMTQAIVTFQAQIAGDTTVYNVTNSAGTAFTLTLTTDPTNILMPFSVNAPTAGSQFLGLLGILKVRATAALTGTPGGTDILKVTFLASVGRP